MRQTNIINSNNFTTVEVVVNDVKTTFTFQHDIIPEPLAIDIATAIAKIPSSYARLENQE